MLKDRFCGQIAQLLATDDWLIAENGYDCSENLEFEARFCLANGRMGNRASHEEGDVRRTLPANYVHGVFDRSEAYMRELCNTPNWALLRVSFQGQPIGPESGEMSDYLRVLDMRSALVAKRYVMTDAQGRKTQVQSLKYLSRAHPRCGMLRVYITPVNYGGVFDIQNQIDATVTNFQDMPRFQVKHLVTQEVSDLDALGCYVQSLTRDFSLPIGTGACVKMYMGNEPLQPQSRHFRALGEVGSEFLDARLQPGQTLRLDKYAAVATGRDCRGVRAQVKRELESLVNLGWDEALEIHRQQELALWARADLEIIGDELMQKALRFNIFHLMNTPDPIDPTVNVGAKLLHGEEYGGHAYWDTELFVLPYFCFVFPRVARNLVKYRWLLLEKALENARALGYAGAKYPWESADTGEEECPAWTIEYDGSVYRCHVADYEHHVTSAVAYGINRYVQVTGDHGFMDDMGMEVLLETARFWSSRMTLNAAKDRYEICQVTGPDEWHEPVDNNAYTNHLARWNILEALRLFKDYEKRSVEASAALCRRLDLSDREMQAWQDRADRLFLQGEEGLIEQFDGYFAIEDSFVSEWDENGMPLMPENQRRKRGLERKILKQADVVMLMHLLPDQFDLDTQKTNYRYYEQRTLHRSSLSPSIHCMMGLRVGDSKRAYDYLRRSAFVDLDNNQRNTREGIHAASAAGTWQCVVMGYCGLEVSLDGKLSFAPRLPDHWQAVRFSLDYRGQLLRVEVTPHDAQVICAEGPVPYRVFGEDKISSSVTV